MYRPNFSESYLLATLSIVLMVMGFVFSLIGYRRNNGVIMVIGLVLIITGFLIAFRLSHKRESAC